MSPLGPQRRSEREADCMYLVSCSSLVLYMYCSNVHNEPARQTLQIKSLRLREGACRAAQLRLGSASAHLWQLQQNSLRCTPLASQLPSAGTVSSIIYKMCHYQNIKNSGKARYKENWIFVNQFLKNNSEPMKGVNERSNIFQPLCFI